MKRSLLAIIAFLVCGPGRACAQQHGAVALGEAVAGLGVTTRVLVIGAHPDDEDTRLIAWLQRGHHVETAYLSLTRGDGGQNLLGDELGNALGVIRTQELLAARRIDGAEQYFTRAYDFGFSKSAAETLEHWSHDSVLKDVVTVVRAFRPQVIVSVFTGTPRDGHGNHQVAGIVAREAYDAAADTVRFPRSATQGLGPWTPLKFYRGAWFNHTSATMSFDVGAYDPLIGKSYAEIAAESRSQHKSQGFGRLQRKGAQLDFVKREGSRVNANVPPGEEHSLFDGIDTTWTRLVPLVHTTAQRAALDSLGQAIQAAQHQLDLFHPAGAVPALARVKMLLDRVRCEPARGASCGPVNADVATTLHEGEKRAARALMLAAGVAVEATVPRPVVASSDPAYGHTGDSIPVTVAVYDQGPLPVQVRGITLVGASHQASWAAADPVVTIAPDSAYQWSGAATFDSLTQPWWLVTPREHDMFTQPASTRSEAARELRDYAQLRLDIGGAPVEAMTQIVYHHADPLRGDYRRPLEVVPAISVTLDRTVEYAPAGAALDRSVRVHLRSGSAESRTVRVALRLPAGLRADSAVRTATLSSPGATQTVTFRVRGRVAAGAHTISATATVAPGAGARMASARPAVFTTGYIPIDYSHITPQTLYRDAAIRLQAVDVKLPSHLQVGYIKGVGDNVAPMLQEIGVPITDIDPTTLATTNLGRYTTIVIGTRAYASHPALLANNARLFDYVRRGGTLVVQYGQYEMQRPGIMPYPITLTRPADRVTDENAPVTVLRPKSPLLNWPNAIGASDWRGWVQERSLYMPHTFDSHYTPILAMNDPGEQPDSAAILIARYGAGTYVYTTLSLFRQLPAGVPGGARIFANLLGAGCGTARAAGDGTARKERGESREAACGVNAVRRVGSTR
ncbi:MAG TPA: PIG-L family deacetylase [Gemmatimonadaceae bacterium]|nr:PIG-L family deacetylase [Gemmatimonadaceae bacterium]